MDTLQDVAPHKISKDLQACVASFLGKVMHEIEDFEAKQDDLDSTDSHEDPSGQKKVDSRMQYFNQSVENSRQMKGKVDKLLKDSLFTRLVKEKFFLEKEMQKCQKTELEIDKWLAEGKKQKEARECKFDQNYEALKKVIQEISSCEVMEFIKKSTVQKQPQSAVPVSCPKAKIQPPVASTNQPSSLKH